MRPFEYVFLDSMPKNAVEKMDIKRLENWDGRA